MAGRQCPAASNALSEPAQAPNIFGNRWLLPSWTAASHLAQQPEQLLAR